MAIRTLIFNVTADNKPIYKDPVWAGMQFEDNATEIVFSPDKELTQMVGESALFRIDFNSSAGYSPSSNLSADENGNYKRTLPYSMTFIGGEIEAVFVITSAEGNLELLSFPVTLYLTDIKRDAVCDDELHKGLSMVEESVRQLSLIAEESADKAQKSAEAAEAALVQTEESVQRFEEAAEAKANLQVKKIEGEFWAYNGITEGTQTSILESIEPSDMVGSEEIYLYFSDGIVLGTSVDIGEFSIGSKYVISKSSDGVVVNYVAQIIDLSDKVNVFDIDHTYDPQSENAQSGKAVAEALANVGGSGLKEYELLCDTTITEDVASVKWTTTDNGEPIGDYKDFFIYFLGKFTAEETKTIWCRGEGNYFLWANFAKKTSTRGFWISIEQIFSTDEIDSAPNATTRDGTVIFISKYPNNLLANVTEGNFETQGLSDNNQGLKCDTTIGGTTDLPLKELEIGQNANATAIFASGSRFLLLGRKA